MKKITNKKIVGRNRRHARIRAKISGTTERPRLALYRSNQYLSAQVIDDTLGKTLASVTTKNMKGKTLGEKVAAAGNVLAESAKKAGVSEVVFDRGGFSYIGNVKLFADTVREGGITF